MMTHVPEPTPIYRIMHIDNLSLVLQRNALLCGNEIKRLGLHYKSIGYMQLTRDRSQRLVTCSERGTLTDYVPFYFCPRSPMLYCIDRGTVPTYTEGQEPIIYLQSTVESIIQHNRPFFFTNMHSYLTIAQQYDDINNLEMLEWEVIDSQSWANTNEDPNRRAKKQAEFLVHNHVPWSSILKVGVYSERYRQDVLSILRQYNVNTSVAVQTGWYY